MSVSDFIGASLPMKNEPTKRVYLPGGYVLEVDIQGAAETWAREPGTWTETRPQKSVEECQNLFHALIEGEVEWQRLAPDVEASPAWRDLPRKILKAWAKDQCYQSLIGRIPDQPPLSESGFFTEVRDVLKKICLGGDLRYEIRRGWLRAEIREIYEPVEEPIPGARFIVFPYFIEPVGENPPGRWIARQQRSEDEEFTPEHLLEFHDSEEAAIEAIWQKVETGKTALDVKYERNERIQKWVAYLLLALFLLGVLALRFTFSWPV